MGDLLSPAQKQLKQKIISAKFVPSEWESDNDLNRNDEKTTSKLTKAIKVFFLVGGNQHV